MLIIIIINAFESIEQIKVNCLAWSVTGIVPHSEQLLSVVDDEVGKALV